MGAFHLTKDSGNFEKGMDAEITFVVKNPKHVVSPKSEPGAKSQETEISMKKKKKTLRGCPFFRKF